MPIDPNLPFAEFLDASIEEYSGIFPDFRHSKKMRLELFDRCFRAWTDYRAPKRKTQKNVSPEVLRIYKAYPRHTCPTAAYRAIAKVLGNVPLHFIEDRVAAFAEAVSRWTEEDRKHFVPHPATWFNKGQYNDDPNFWERKGSRPRQAPKETFFQYDIPEPHNWRPMILQSWSPKSPLFAVADDLKRRWKDLPRDTQELIRKAVGL